MKRQLLSLPRIPDELSINTDKDKIAELLGVSWTQERSPELFFFHKNSLYKFEAYDWQSETKRYYIWNYGLDGFKVEDENQEIIELKAANKALGDTVQRVMKARDQAFSQLENLQSDLLESDKSKVHKDLLLEIVAAAHGKKLN
jgi:hypothetical protein